MASKYEEKKTCNYLLATYIIFQRCFIFAVGFKIIIYSGFKVWKKTLYVKN